MTQKRLLMIGGGHSHALTLHNISKAKGEWQDISITIVSTSSKSPYSGMMTGAIADLYVVSQIYYDVSTLAEKAGAKFIAASCVKIDTLEKTVFLDDGQNLFYDVLSLDCGSTPSILPGAVGVKPIENVFSTLNKIEKESASVPQSIDVIGAGTSGCEVAMSLSGRARRLGHDWKIRLHEASDHILPGQSEQLRAAVSQHLARNKIEVVLGKTDRPNFQGTVINCTPGRAADWLGSTGLQTDAKGFVIHDRMLTTSNPFVFASGDMAMNPSEPVPRAGVYAVRQAPILTLNLLAALSGKSLTEYRPQNKFLSLMVDGHGQAFASRGDLYLGQSRFFLWLKDKIDKKFMQKVEG